jgi:hypothetical protein
VGTPGGKKPCGRSRHGREENVAVDLKEMGLKTMTCINLVVCRDKWRALLNVVTNLQVA